MSVRVNFCIAQLSLYRSSFDTCLAVPTEMRISLPELNIGCQKGDMVDGEKLLARFHPGTLPRSMPSSKKSRQNSAAVLLSRTLFWGGRVDRRIPEDSCGKVESDLSEEGDKSAQSEELVNRRRSP